MMIFHTVNFISFTKHFISSSAGWEGNGADGGNEGGGGVGGSPPPVSPVAPTCVGWGESHRRAIG